ncbi:hypothetical protein [Alistipes putredinis]
MMNNNGLYIKEFEARGENVSTSKLTFQKGCNVVLGKSDTGKTTLYSIIEFVLGKGSIDLTLPPEGDGYTDFLLEIHTYDERVYTLRRSINSMSVYVSPCLLSEYDGQHKETEYSCQGSSNISLSDFLLSISNVPTIYSKSSERKNPTKISYPAIRHLCMIDETRVAAKDKSPLVYNSVPNQQWVEKNLIAYLMTGVDDSEFRPNEDPKDKKSRINGKIEYLTQTLKEAELKLESLGDVGYISLTDDSFIDVYRKKLSEVASEEEALYNKREQILEEVRIYETEKKKLLHLISRLNNLKSDYEDEMSRLQFINAGNSLVSQLKDVDCPLCGSTIAHHMIANISSSEYAEAIRNEYNEIYFKQVGDKNWLNFLSSMISVNQLYWYRSYLYKDQKEYEHEHEWRMLYYNLEDENNYASIPDVGCLNAIYYGPDIIPKDKDELHLIAVEKGLKEYDVALDAGSRRYDLRITAIK